MGAIKIMLVNVPPPIPHGEFVLVVSKMSRLFFIKPDKIVSISFPFSVRTEDGALAFGCAHHPNIDHGVTSKILSLVDADEVIEAGDVLAFADKVFEESEGDPDLWSLLRYLLTEEDGYVRYDHDALRANGHFHPLHHLDVFYSGPATFKLGLPTEIDRESLTNLFDLTTECLYVTRPSSAAIDRFIGKLSRR